jgi:DNA-directed RNA polymerase specialized sigma24 family protein
MEFPEGVGEADFLAAVENAVTWLAPSFVFGSYDVDDIRQEAFLAAAKALPRYDPGGAGPDGLPRRKLENFIYTAVKNGLINVKRDLYRRADPPCVVCHRSAGHRSDHPSGEWCRHYLEWKKRNDAKASLQQPLGLERVPDERQGRASEVEEGVATAELLRLIDERLPVELRATYLQMRAGRAVPKARRLEVEEAVKGIVGEGP